jgi:hypothetical protein
MKALLLAGVAVLVMGIAPAQAEYRGNVYLLVNPQAPREKWERRPLPGAFVAVSWTMVIPAPGHAVDKCLYVELARTDDNGEYVMEGPNPVAAGLADAGYRAYSPGLEAIAFPYPGSRMSPKEITMAFSTRDADGRLSQLALFTDPGCPDTKLDDPRALLVPYLGALLDEAKSLKVDSPLAQRDVAQIQAALRSAAGLDRAEPMRAVPVQGRVESAAPAARK